MNSKRTLPIWLLSLAFLALHATHYVKIEALPWLHHLALFTPLPLAIMLVLLLTQSERVKEDLTSLHEQAAVAGKSLSEDLGRLRRMQEALTDLKQQVEHNTQTIRSSDTLLQAKLLLYQDKFDEAASLFAETLENDPADPQLNYWCGLAFLKGGDAEAASTYLGRAARARQADATILETYADCLVACSKHLEAAKQFTLTLAAGPKNLEMVRRKLGQSQLRFDASAGEQTLKNLLVDNPANVPVIVPLARAYLDQGRLDEAIAICDRALQAVPTLHNVLPLRAEALLKRNSPGDEAIAQVDLHKAESNRNIGFHANRVRGEWLLYRAMSLADPTDRRAKLLEARAQLELGIQRAAKNAKVQAQLRALLAMSLLLLGELEGALEAAKQAKDSVAHYFNTLTFLECLFSANKWITLAAEASVSAGTDNRSLVMWCHFHLLLAKLFSGESLPTLRAEIGNLLQSVRDTPKFDPRSRPIWKYIRVAAPLQNVTEPQRAIAEALLDYLESSRSDILFQKLEGFAA